MWVAVSFWSLAQGRFEGEKQSRGVGTLSETVGQTSSIDLIQNYLWLLEEENLKKGGFLEDLE